MSKSVTKIQLEEKNLEFKIAEIQRNTYFCIRNNEKNCFEAGQKFTDTHLKNFIE